MSLRFCGWYVKIRLTHGIESYLTNHYSKYMGF